MPSPPVVTHSPTHRPTGCLSDSENKMFWMETERTRTRPGPTWVVDSPADLSSGGPSPSMPDPGGLLCSAWYRLTSPLAGTPLKHCHQSCHLLSTSSEHSKTHENCRRLGAITDTLFMSISGYFCIVPLASCWHRGHICLQLPPQST